VKIDAFCHIMPRPYYDRFFTLEETVHAANLRKRVANIPCLVDMDVRFAQMDEFGDYRQLINICAHPVEDLGSPEISRQMYGDTAMFGAAHALRCCIDFYGTDHILFGSDSPFDPERGPGYIRATIANLEEIGLTPAEREAIFSGNITRLTGLTVRG
jgi:hypothetical protein